MNTRIVKSRLYGPYTLPYNSNSQTHYKYLLNSILNPFNNDYSGKLEIVWKIFNLHHFLQ